jgi:Barstar (barnase inhibitor)
MAIFRAGDENELDYVTIRDGGITIYRSLKFLEEDIQWLRDRNYRIYRFDCAAWVSEDAMHENLQRELSFPDYYGKNFNALNDVVPDLDVPDEGGVALVLISYDTFVNGPGTSLAGCGVDRAEILLDILSRASHSLLLAGKRFLTIIQSNDPRLHYEALGGRPAGWNWRVWLHKDRGL